MHFFRRHVRGRPPHPDVLTPAEWRVLEHVRERRTNAEIAVRLGVSVNTVRTHVSSMLAKLDVADREELARWRGEPTVATRAALDGGRATLATGPLAWLRERWSGAKAVATGVAVVVVGAVIVGGASVASSLDTDEEATPTPAAAAVTTTPPSTETPSPTPTVSARPPLGPTEKPSPTPQPRFVPGAEARTISGLFSDPQPTVPDEYRSLDPNPRESFGPWNREDVVLYDLETMTERNLGPGAHPEFTPDGEYLYWIAGRLDEPEDQELWVLDLDTGEPRSLGLARQAVWVDAEHFGAALPGGNTWVLVTIATGERTTLAERPEGVYVLPWLREAGGFRIEAIPGPPQQQYPYAYTAYRVIDTSGGLAPLEFDALAAQLTSDGTLIVVTPPVDLRLQADLYVVGQSGSSNIFEVDLDTGAATFIATARMAPPSGLVAADDRHIVWTDNYCEASWSPNAAGGRTRIYDRDTGTLTELDKALYVTAITPDGELADGPFGADALIDIESLTYTAKFAMHDRSWSPDYRYTAIGVALGHGGICGG